MQRLVVVLAAQRVEEVVGQLLRQLGTRLGEELHQGVHGDELAVPGEGARIRADPGKRRRIDQHALERLPDTLPCDGRGFPETGIKG